jgi:hypothetical protein
MMKSLMVVLLVMTSNGAVAQTSVPSDSTAPSNVPTEVKPSKPICRSETTMGSRFTTRTCHSKREWAAIDAANAAIIERNRNPQSIAGHH